MTSSLTVPTATSVRSFRPSSSSTTASSSTTTSSAAGREGQLHPPDRVRGGASAEHVAGDERRFNEEDGKPAGRHAAARQPRPRHRPAEPRRLPQLLVPSIKGAETMDFRQFWTATRTSSARPVDKLAIDRLRRQHVWPHQPGQIGTAHSVPRLMQGQGCIIGIGSLEYPAAFQGASRRPWPGWRSASRSRSPPRTTTGSSRARSPGSSCSGSTRCSRRGRVLRHIFESLRIPYEPVRWIRLLRRPRDDVNRSARVQEMIHAYRVRGHLMADTDPLEFRQRKHPDLDISSTG